MPATLTLVHSAAPADPDVLDHVAALSQVQMQLKWIARSLDRAWEHAEFAPDPRAAYSAACADAVVSAQQVQDALGAVIAAMAMQAEG